MKDQKPGPSGPMGMKPADKPSDEPSNVIRLRGSANHNSVATAQSANLLEFTRELHEFINVSLDGLDLDELAGALMLEARGLIHSNDRLSELTQKEAAESVRRVKLTICDLFLRAVDHTDGKK